MFYVAFVAEHIKDDKGKPECTQDGCLLSLATNLGIIFGTLIHGWTHISLCSPSMALYVANILTCVTTNFFVYVIYLIELYRCNRHTLDIRHCV
jgi:hypothetical protein